MQTIQKKVSSHSLFSKKIFMKLRTAKAKIPEWNSLSAWLEKIEKKCTLSLSLKKHEAHNSLISWSGKGLKHLHEFMPSNLCNLCLKIEQLKKWAKFDHVRIFQELKEKKNYFGWNVSWMLKIHQLSFFGGVLRLPPYKANGTNSLHLQMGLICTYISKFCI